MTGEIQQGGHLRRLLVDAGVGSKWAGRELERMCGKDSTGKPRLSYQSWNRMVRPGEEGHDWSPAVLRLVAETLRKAGADITHEQVTRAWAADYGHGSYVSVTRGDSKKDMIERLPYLDPEDLAEIEAAAASLRAAKEKDRRSRDDREGGHPRSE